MRQELHVSLDEIARIGVLRRSIPAVEVRRVHVFSDANGDDGIVVRSALFRFVHISRGELADPALTAQVRALVDRVRPQARVDDDVDHFLASVA
jgi:hypothetical protein